MCLQQHIKTQGESLRLYPRKDSPLSMKKSLNIKEIGYALGFEDPSYFVKFFKRMEGIMPSEFRKES